MKNALGVIITALLSVAIASGLGKALESAQARPIGPLNTTIAVMNVVSEPAVVTVHYRGAQGTCQGEAFAQGPVAIPAGAMVMFAPAPDDDSILPAECVASAIIEAEPSRTAASRIAAVISVDDALKSEPPHWLAAYTAIGVAQGTHDVAVPLYRRHVAEPLFASGVHVVNLGPQDAHASLRLRESSGNPITLGTDADRVVAPGETGTWYLPDMEAVPDDSYGSARIESDQPVAVVVSDIPRAGIADMALYNGLNTDIGFDPGEDVFDLPILLKEAAVLHVPGWSTIRVQNFDVRNEADMGVVFFDPGGGRIGPRGFPGPAADHTIDIDPRKLPELPPGMYAAVGRSTVPVGGVVRTDWPDSGGAAFNNAPAPSSDVAVPLLINDSAGQTSFLSIHNTTPDKPAPAILEFLPAGQSKPLLSTAIEIKPGASITFDLARDRLFARVPAGVTGAIRIRSEWPLTVQAITASDNEEAIAAYEGVPVELAANVLVAPLVYSAWPPDLLQEPTPKASPSPTATRHEPTSTATPSPTSTRRAPTRTSTVSPSVTPRQATSTPTREASPAPVRTPDVLRKWTRFTPQNSLLQVPHTRYAEAGQDGYVWLRLPRPEGGPDYVVVVHPELPWRRFDNLRDAVEAESDSIWDQGSLRDMWAVDQTGHVWTGPEFYDGQTWTVVAESAASTGATLEHDSRALTFGDAEAAVPFSTSIECPPPSLCHYDGLRGYTIGHDVVFDVRFDGAPEAGRYSLADVHLVPSVRRPAAGLSLNTGAKGLARLLDQQSPDQGTSGPAYAVARKGLYVLPDTAPVPYPLLEEPPSPGGPLARNAGYATAATLRPDGRLEVFTWVEKHSLPPSRDVSWLVLANTWTGSDWEVVDLTTSPMFGGDVRYERIVASVYCSDGSLWLGSSSGTVAARHTDGSWEITGDELPLDDQERITDIACGTDGTVWLATENGLLGGMVVISQPIYAPWTSKP